jgi:hypothetical protein
MCRRKHTVRAHLDRLEARDVPAANLTVTFSALTHTLTVVGDANDNDVTVTGDATSQTRFSLASTGTINGQPSPFSTPDGVKNLVFKMLDGNDTVTFDNTVPIFVQGSVSINGGAGVNSVTASHLTVGKNLSVTNAAQSTGTDSVNLTDYSSGGNVMVKNAGGDSFTQINRDAPGVSTIKGSLTVTNGTGVDDFFLIDTNVDGNVTVNNGHGTAPFAGNFDVETIYSSPLRLVIGGNLTVSYLDGNSTNDNGIFDTEVLGNVTLNYGTGTSATDMYAQNISTELPVLIHGNLTITGTGSNTARLDGDSNDTGVVVEKGFTFNSGGATAETLVLKNLQVGGNTSLKLGNGGNTVTINDSYFGGRFTLVSGSGNDTFNVETQAGTSSATEFKKAVLVDLGTGSDVANIASNGGAPDAAQYVVAWSTFEVEATGGALSASHVLFPNGGAILN